MKIGLMLRSLDEKKGIGTYTNNLLETMLQIDQKNEYVLLYSNKNNLGRYAYCHNVRERYLPPANRLLGESVGKLLWDQVTVAYTASQEKFDILFNPKFTVPLLAPCKTVTVLHGSEWYVNPHFYEKLDVLYIKLMMPLYVRRADIVIAVSNRAREDIALFAGADLRKVKTFYSAPDERFKQLPDRGAVKAVKEKYNLPERFILNVGKIYPGKNIKNILRAYARIYKSIPHKLVIAGPLDSKHSDELKPLEEYALHDNVIFPGWVSQDDMPALYSMADLFLFPSLYESCPIALLEAMASGCAVVASNTGGTPEIAGNAAILVDPNDYEAIADASHSVLADEKLRQELIRKGLEQSEGFSWEKYARDLLTLFESLNGCDR